MKGVTLAFATACVVITVRDLKDEHRAPVPAEFLGIGVLFAGLALIGEIPQAGPAVSIAAWGLVVAAFLAGNNQVAAFPGQLGNLINGAPKTTPGGQGKSGFTKKGGSTGGGSGGGGGGSW